tara:strand:+ start:443 stop:976 length:534 start_codon:yes stop_codon:yes gene_type:complete
LKKPYLVIIDVQEKLFPVMHNKDNFLKNLIILIKGFQLFDLPIMLTEQVPENLGPTIKEIKSLIPEIQPIIKSSFSCATNPEFSQQAVQYSQSDGVVLAGIETHVCIYQTGNDLIQNGEHIEIVTDAVTARKENNHCTGLDRLKANGCLMTTVEMLLFSMQEDANGNRFRELIKLVK